MLEVSQNSPHSCFSDSPLSSPFCGLGVTLDSGQVLLLVLQSGITSECLVQPFGVPGIKFRSATCMASVLPAVLVTMFHDRAPISLWMPCASKPLSLLFITIISLLDHMEPCFHPTCHILQYSLSSSSERNAKLIREAAQWAGWGAGFACRRY